MPFVFLTCLLIFYTEKVPKNQIIVHLYNIQTQAAYLPKFYCQKIHEMIESPETLADDYFLGMYKCGWWSYHYSLIRQVWDSEDYQSLMLLLKRVLYYVANRNRFNLDIKCKFHFLISFFFFFCLTSTLRQLWKEPGKDWSEALSAKSPCLLSVGGDPKNSVPEYNRTLEMYSLHTS